MFKEIQEIFERIPNAESRSDVWALQTLGRIISGDCNDPAELQYFSQSTSYKSQYYTLLSRLRAELNTPKQIVS